MGTHYCTTMVWAWPGFDPGMIRVRDISGDTQGHNQGIIRASLHAAFLQALEVACLASQLTGTLYLGETIV
jgi:hypothetical protein